MIMDRTEQTLADYFRSARTLTEEDVRVRAVVHDSHDLTADEERELIGHAAAPHHA